MLDPAIALVSTASHYWKVHCKFPEGFYQYQYQEYAGSASAFTSAHIASMVTIYDNIYDNKPICMQSDAYVSCS